MEGSLPQDPAALLKTPLQCRACGARTVTIMEVETLFDRIAWAAWYAPVLCRICHSKFYRRIRKELEETVRARPE